MGGSSQKIWALAARLVDCHQLLDEHWNPHLWDRDESKGTCQTNFFESQNTKLIKHVILGSPLVHNWPGWHTSAWQLRESILDCLLSRRSSFVPSVVNHAWRSAAYIHIWKLLYIHHFNFLCCVLVYIDEVCSSIPQSIGTLLPDCKVWHPILRLLFLLKLCITETRNKWFTTRKSLYKTGLTLISLTTWVGRSGPTGYHARNPDLICVGSYVRYWAKESIYQRKPRTQGNY